MSDLKDCDPEDTLTQEVRGQRCENGFNNAPSPPPYHSPPPQCCVSGRVSVFLVSTYTEGSPPEAAKWFCQWLSEAVADFRVHKSLLSGLHFAVFGLGNSLYGEHYNAVAKNLFDWLSQLSATSVCPLGLGDQNVAGSSHGGKLGRGEGELELEPSSSPPIGIEEDFTAWRDGFVKELFPALLGEKPLPVQWKGRCGEGEGEEKRSCECGKKPKQDCCKAAEKKASSLSSSSQPQDGEVSSCQLKPQPQPLPFLSLLCRFSTRLLVMREKKRRRGRGSKVRGHQASWWTLRILGGWWTR